MTTDGTLAPNGDDDVGDAGLPWPDPAAFLGEAMASANTLPNRIGRYSIVSVLGEGGMGVVYRARQEHPTREVALKVLAPGRGGTQHARRFQREIEVLGQLEHRSIARLYDAGTADLAGSAVPFFAMELVDGATITNFAEQSTLDVRARVRLVVEVCHAVAFAHARGVIHRDLKPGNVLVTAAGEPKVLDFGIARMAASESAPTLHTETGQILGTLAYMSPEQVSGDPEQVDAQSDVYALGVLGYELLTGRQPLDVRKHSLTDAARVIQEHDPLPLSAFDRSLAGDLDAIFATALEKEKSRRYPSATALANDLTRFLTDRPVEARAPTALDTLRRLFRRHRIAAFASSAIALTLLVATAVSLSFALSASRQRTLAEQRAAETERVARFQAEILERVDIEAMGRGIEQSYRERVEKSLASQRVQDGSEWRSRSAAEIESALAGFDSSTAGVLGADIARSALDDHLLGPAARALESRDVDSGSASASPTDPPLVRARFHYALGAAYHTMLRLDTAQHHLSQALEIRIRELGPDALDVAEASHTLGAVLFETGNVAAALPLLERAVDIRSRRLGPDSLESISSLSSLALVAQGLAQSDRAETTYRKALELAERHRSDAPQWLADVQQNLGMLHIECHRLGDAETMLRESVANYRSASLLRNDEQLRMAAALTNLAHVLKQIGRTSEAGTLFQESLEIHQRICGEEHPRTINVLRHLAGIQAANNDLAAAEATVRRTLELSIRVHGPRHTTTANCTIELGTVLSQRGDPENAKHFVSEGVALLESQAEPARLELGRAYGRLAVLEQIGGNLVEAAKRYEQALTTLREALGSDHVDLAEICNNYGTLLRATRRPDAALPHFREAVRLDRTLGDHHAPLGNALAGLGRVLADLGEHAEAVAQIREGLAILAETTGRKSERTILAGVSLATSLVALEQFDAAESALTTAHGSLDLPAGPSRRAVLAVLSGLVALHERWAIVAEDPGHATRAAEWKAQRTALESEAPGADANGKR